MRLILTYHSLHARDWSYAGNDHIALWHDLLLLRRRDYRVVPLASVVSAVHEDGVRNLPERCAALTFDDGVNHDFIDFHHPEFGLLPSFRNIIEQSIAAGFPASATSFVIASPRARKALDRICIAGRGDWNDDWWPDAATLDYWEIANHSWDHNHASLDARSLPDAAPGQFATVETPAAADTQVARAGEYIAERTGGRSQPWFAYPFGQANAYLAERYLPEIPCVEAAFTTAGDYLAPNTEPYRIPRFVCGEHWKHPAGLDSILDG